MDTAEMHVTGVLVLRLDGITYWHPNADNQRHPQAREPSTHVHSPFCARHRSLIVFIRLRTSQDPQHARQPGDPGRVRPTSLANVSLIDIRVSASGGRGMTA